MAIRKARRAVVPALLAGAIVSSAVAVPADAGSTRTSGTGRYLDVGWTEYDPDDLLGLPGNVHIGYLYVDSGPYGSWAYGNVTDFDCDEGEVPWGGGHVGIEHVVAEGADVVEGATEDAIDAAVDGGGAVIASGVVVDTIAADLGEELPDEIIEEVPACDYVQDRFLDGTDSLTVNVDLKKKVATVTGRVTVHGGHGEHGEPGVVLGRPPVNITITGGEWNQFEWTYESRGKGWSYSDSQKGTSYWGGTVTGGIGAMGFADDADDESYGSFTQYSYKTKERIR